MTEKRKKVAASVTGSASKAPNEHFMSEFLINCEHYFVDPLPIFSVVNGFREIHYPISQTQLSTKSLVDLRDISDNTFSSTDQNTGNIENPLISVTFENPKIFTNPKKIVCKGYEISIFWLDALKATLPSYRTITVLKLPNCQINAYGIEIIAEMLTKVSCILDLNLDMNPNLRENYYLLCSSIGKLQFLSLKLCKISDNGVMKISEALKFQDPPNSPKLIGLNLANNYITDIGAHYIATMLRTNRSLQSLNLASNKIQDIGASAMIEELCIIKLTHVEIVELRRRNFARLLLQDKMSEENQAKGEGNSRNIDGLDKDGSSKIKIDNLNLKRPQTSRNSKFHRQHSFSKGQEYYEYDSHESEYHPLKKEGRPINGEILSTGNLNLQHLNLNWNALTSTTLNKLINCIYYQDYLLSDDFSQGLLFIKLEGIGFEKENNSLWKEFKDVLAHRRREETKILNINYESKISSDIIALRNEIRKISPFFKSTMIDTVKSGNRLPFNNT